MDTNAHSMICSVIVTEGAFIWDKSPLRSDLASLRLS